VPPSGAYVFAGIVAPFRAEAGQVQACGMRMPPASAVGYLTPLLLSTRAVVCSTLPARGSYAVARVPLRSSRTRPRSRIPPPWLRDVAVWLSVAGDSRCGKRGDLMTPGALLHDLETQTRAAGAHRSCARTPPHVASRTCGPGWPYGILPHVGSRRPSGVVMYHPRRGLHAAIGRFSGCSAVG
jgi:hypothetical protein